MGVRSGNLKCIEGKFPQFPQPLNVRIRKLMNKAVRCRELMKKITYFNADDPVQRKEIIGLNKKIFGRCNIFADQLQPGDLVRLAESLEFQVNKYKCFHPQTFSARASWMNKKFSCMHMQLEHLTLLQTTSSKVLLD